MIKNLLARLTRKSETPPGFHRHPNGGGLVANTAKVADTAYIGRNVKVLGNAEVPGDARIFDNVCVTGKVRTYCGSYQVITIVDKNWIGVDCVRGTLSWWLKNYAEVLMWHSYTDEEMLEYGMQLELLKEIL